MFFTNATRRLLCMLLCLTLLISTLMLPAASVAASAGVTNAKVVLRKSADKESSALQSIPEDEEVSIISTSGSWYKVRYGKFTGYVMKKYVDKASSSSAAAKKIDALGSAPGIMRVGDENRDVLKLQKALDILGYYDGKLDGKYGAGTKEAVKEYQKDEGLTADGYAGERTVKSIFGSCSSRSLTTQPDPGKESSGSSSASSSKTASKYKTVSSISAIGSPPGKTEVGDSGKDVVKLQQALEYLGYYDGAIDGDFGKGTEAAVKRFQAKRGMNDDGIAGASTIRVLFGSTASSSSSGSSSSGSSSSSSTTKYKTEVLDWYADNVSRVIPKNARFTVKDVGTGRTFEMRRWSGGDHMDAEPVSDEDTATLKSIYGGSWSWRRRPILIKYNGHVYAASMNGMPHGTSTLSNDFDGHLCIHFKNSKTHGSDKVDPDHQNAIQKASKYTW